MFNPNALDLKNGVFPEEVYNNFSPALRKLALIYSGLALTGYLLVTEPKDVAVTDKSKGVKAAELPGLTITEALMTKQFWLLW